MHVLLPKHIKWKAPMRPSKRTFRHVPAKDEYNGLTMTREDQPHFGKYGLMVLEEGWITSRQLEQLRRVIVTAIERRGKVYMRAFPHQAITQRMAESRVGATKGKIEYWVAALKANFILMEVDGVAEDVARNAFRLASRELPIKCRMVVKEHLPEEYELGELPPAREPAPGYAR